MVNALPLHAIHIYTKSAVTKNQRNFIPEDVKFTSISNYTNLPCFLKQLSSNLHIAELCFRLLFVVNLIFKSLEVIFNVCCKHNKTHIFLRKYFLMINCICIHILCKWKYPLFIVFNQVSWHMRISDKSLFTQKWSLII